MMILGFESTAHTFGAAVVESFAKKGDDLSPKNTKIISENDKKYPSLKEGFIPRKLADFHAKNFDGILLIAYDYLIFRAKLYKSNL